MPSLVLRAVDAQETLWSLAKKYSTTIPVILAANGLKKQEDVPPEKLLLIPRKRA
jgi:LysM repeat protein